METIINDKEVSKIEIIEELYIYTEVRTIINGSLREVADNILALENRLRTEHEDVVQNPNKYIRFNIRVQNEYASHDAEIRLYGVRLETNEEFESRQKRFNNIIKAQKASAKKRTEKKQQQELDMFILTLNKFRGNKKTQKHK